MIPLHKACPRFKRAAKCGHGNLPPAILLHVGFFSLRFNFCGTARAHRQLKVAKYIDARFP